MMPILFILIAVILLMLLFRFNMRSVSKDALQQVEFEQQTAAAQEVKEQEITFEFVDSVSPAEKEKPASVMKIHTDTKIIDNDYRQALIQFQKGSVQEEAETVQEEKESKDKMDDNQYRNAMLSLKNKQRKK